MPRSLKHSQSGTTLVETAVAVMLIAGFFASIFEMNTVCLHYINASKESVAALQGVQDRLETLRNLLFSDLTNPTYLQTLMATPSNQSEFATTQPTETVTVTRYSSSSQNTSGQGIQIQRPPGASVTATIVNSGTSNISQADLVQVDVQYTWNTTLGQHDRTEHTATIVAAGTKK